MDLSTLIRKSDTKGSLGRAFTCCYHLSRPTQKTICPSTQRKVSNRTVVLIVHLCYPLAGVPPQPNSLLDHFMNHIHSKYIKKP